MPRAKVSRGRLPSPLALSGPVTLAEVARLRELILSGITPDADLRLDLSDSGPWDLAGLQLLLSAGVMARKLGRKLVLEGVPDSFLAVAGSAAATESLDGFAAGSAVGPLAP